MFDRFALSVRGSSHIRENIARQDCAATYVDPDGWAMAAVSDGHGGDDYFRSHIGSRFAVESAMKSVKGCLGEKKILLETLREGENARDRFFHRLASSILTGWRAYIDRFEEAVQAYADEAEPVLVDFDFGGLTVSRELPDGGDGFVQDGISLEWEEAWCAEHEVKRSETHPERLYGCTLLIAVMAPEFCFSLQIGDGCCVAAYSDGHTEMMIPIEEGQVTNITDSLCESRALERFKHALLLFAEETALIETTYEDEIIPEGQESAELPLQTETEEELKKPAVTSPTLTGILLSTDGLFNSCNTADDFLQFNRAVLARMQPDSREAFSGELEEHLALRSKKGSSDDISMSIVFHSEMDYEAMRK